MRILKIKGKDEKIILNEIEKQYGDKAVIIGTQKEEVGRFSRFFKQAKTVITIAVKDENDEVQEKDKVTSVPTITPVKEAEPKEEAISAAQMLSSLNEQIKGMEETLKHMQHRTMEESPAKAEQAKNELLTILEEKLLSIGIKKPLCDGILSSVEDEKNIEDVVRTLYIKIEELLDAHQPEENMPQTVFFIGTTGVGKTTTIAKLTAKYVLEKQKQVVLFTSDTYRIAAIEQLKTYADILGVPIEIIYDEKDIPELLKKWSHMDYIFIDTAGRSHKNEEQVNELLKLLKCVAEKKVFLVLNANTATKDVMNIIDTYKEAQDDFELIITKLDETDEVGNILNISCYAQRPIKYITTGQNVPADIKTFSREEYIVDLLGRIQYE